MNPPTDPMQLLVYGAGTVLVVLALKLWDRRRDGKLQRSTDEARLQATAAAEHASTAMEHAGAAAAVADRLEQRPASGRIQLGYDTGAILLRMLLHHEAERITESPEQPTGRHRA